MKVKDILNQEICVDVYDNVIDGIGVAFDGPVELTEEGKKEFAEVLEYEIKLTDYDTAIVNVDGPEKVWQKKYNKANRFFWAMAGYCSEKNYDKWFK